MCVGWGGRRMPENPDSALLLPTAPFAPPGNTRKGVEGNRSSGAEGHEF